jgi:hypothetical protein
MILAAGYHRQGLLPWGFPQPASLHLSREDTVDSGSEEQGAYPIH